MKSSTSAMMLAATVASLLASASIAAPVDSSTISGLGIRNIGSATMSGRISAVAARQESDGKVTVFVGAASGGVWKSDDGGTSFKPVFDKQPVQSIGAIALDPSNPKTIWVGTGESWTRNSVSIGDGVYKSTDGGENWEKMGLPNSERITRILVHPKDGNIVYVCAPGKLWSDSADRGLYKTTDGGKSWVQILKGANLSTGCSSVTMDPANPEVLYAGLWDFRRKGWTFRSGGDGPDAPSASALMRSTDGGRSWSALTSQSSKGLPKGPWGRVEVVVAPSNAKQVYAFIENIRSALYVSEDGGTTWQERDRSRNMVWRPFYFSRIVVDPTNDKRLFKMNLRMIASEDGGKSFADAAGGSHGDWHDIWINPTNPKHIIGGDDGGLWISHDGGTKWWKSYNLPISQFYHVSTDDKDPYQVYGGLQDNSSWAGDSAYPGGITNQRWENLYGGDGFYAFSDPADSNYAYAEYQGGHISRIDRRTLQNRNIQPQGGYKEKLRFNWNTPIHLSPNEKGTLYIGAQYLFRSRDQGTNWERISPDLTTNDPKRQQQELSGGITVDNSSAEMHTTIYSISESPKNGQVIWAGTDDGNIQVTRDGGKSWKNTSAALPGIPKGSWISWVEASRHDEATAYATVDRHSFGDMGSYVFKTTDYGKSWKALITPATAGVRGYAHVVKEDSINPGLLFVGTELGLWVSVDAGATWAQYKPNNFPDVAVRDIALQSRDHDLALATHGRGIWIVDDISPLRMLNASTSDAEATLISGRAVQQRIESFGGWAEGDATYKGDNPAEGAVITYYQKARHVLGRMKLEVLDRSGKVVADLPTAKRKGLNRVYWAMREKPPVVPPAAQLAGNSAQGPRLLPGDYSVRLTKAGKVYSAPLRVGLDRRVSFSLEDRKVQYDAAMRVSGLFGRMSMLLARINDVRGQADKVAGSLDAKDRLGASARSLSGKADALRKQIVATKEGGAITGEERLREHMDDVYGAITSTEQRPTGYALARVDALEKELKEVEDSFAALVAKDLPALNTQLKAGKKAEITVAAVSLEQLESGGGGRMAAVAEGLVGTRFYGSLSGLAAEADEKD